MEDEKTFVTKDHFAKIVLESVTIIEKGNTSDSPKARTIRVNITADCCCGREHRPKERETGIAGVSHLGKTMVLRAGDRRSDYWPRASVIAG